MAEEIKSTTPVAIEASKPSTPSPAEVADLKDDSAPIDAAKDTSADADPAADVAVKAEDAAKIKNLKKLKLKVDGKEIEEEFDLNDEDTLVRNFQLAKAAQKRMGEYSQLEKEVEAFITELKKNPRKVLADPNIGVDLKQFAAQIIEEEINNSKKSPELLEKEKLEAELKQLKEDQAKERESVKQQEFARKRDYEYNRYKTMINESINKSDLPKSDYTFKKVTDYMLLALQNGMNDISPEDVLPLVKEEMHKDLKDMFSVMPDEVIESMVGKDVIGRIRKKSVAKAKDAAAAPVSSKAPDVGIEKKDDRVINSKDKKKFKDFFGV